MEPGMRRLLPLTAAALALLCALQLLALVRSPTVYFPAAITVALAPNQTVMLGRRELAAPQADLRQLALRRDGAGRWWIRNLSAAHALILDDQRRLGSTPLKTGDSLRVGPALFTVAAAGDQVALSSAGQRWDYDGAVVRRNGQVQPSCPDARFVTRMLAWLPLHMARPLSFGGNLHCAGRVGVAWVGSGSASIARVHGQLLLSAGARAPVLLNGADLADTEAPLDQVAAIGVGATRFALHAGGGQLTLAPQRHVALATEALARLPDGVSWQWQRRALWSAPAWAAWTLLLAAAAGGLLLRHRPALLAAALLGAAGLAALVLQRAGTPPGIGLSLLLGWAALWSCVLLPGRLNLVAAAGVLLLAIGLLAQLELGLGAMESSWPRYFQKSCALLALGTGAAGVLRLHLRAAPFMLDQRALEWLLAALALAALAALLLQVLFGDETGVFDIQPVEFAKLALTALTAHCIAVGLGWRHGAPETGALRRWFRLGAPALVFAALLGLALVQVDDYSPLVLLAVWSMAMALAWAVAARQRTSAAILVGVVCLGAAAIAYLRNAGVDQMVQWGFYADRFLVWLDPAQHPHTGQQLLLGARAIAQGAWMGSDHLLGLSTLGQGAGAALGIPAVQDDFAPAFFLNRHGLAGALALWTLQALFLTALVQCAARAHAASERARDFRQAWLGRFRYFALCGGAAFVLGHLLLSWGTNLAIFPIMGQPMSFLSAGGSHLLFFICPLLGFSAITAQSLDGSEDQRRSDHAGLRPT